ncbi:MFS transporter [Brevibacterium yomogidense]|uniref:MFS transporter n=1 Tax=Brevibacterium yomogidense TaxID=946573 RepID=UPI0018DFC5C2|nr:MFS transporter [Brevibacterium yomogidense]
MEQPQEGARSTVWPLYVVTFLATYTIAVAAISAPGIQNGLQISDSGTSLVVGAYSATFAAGLIFFGRLGDRWGRRHMFRIGTLTWALTATLTAVAPTVEFLVVARLLQGCAAAITTPQVLASIQAILTGRARLRAVGFYSMFAGSGTVAGQVIGGGVNSAFGETIGWRAAFGSVGLLAVIAWLGARHLTETRSPKPLGLDARGSALVAVALLLLIAGLTSVSSIELAAPLSPPGPLVWTAVLLGASAAGFGLLALHARSRERSGRASILPLEILREPAVRTGMALACLLFMMIGGFAYNYAILSQQGFGLSPWQSGAATAMLAVAFVIASALAPRIVVRWGGTVTGGRRTLLMASVVQGVGLVGLGAVALTGVEPFFAWYQLVGVLIGGGQGLMMGPLVSVVMAAVPDEAAGLTGGLVATAQQTGIGLGIAVLSTIFAGLTQLMPMTTAYGWTTLATVLLTAAFALFAARVGATPRE